MIRYLLDTNIISELVRPSPSPNVLERFLAHQHEGAIPSVVWHELFYGIERLASGRRRAYLTRYLLEVVRPSMPIVPFDEAAAVWLARERARLEALGRSLPFADGMIAAIAATHDYLLVTRNTADFADYEGLHLENWFSG